MCLSKVFLELSEVIKSHKGLNSDHKLLYLIIYWLTQPTLIYFLVQASWHRRLCGTSGESLSKEILKDLPGQAYSKTSKTVSSMGKYSPSRTYLSDHFSLRYCTEQGVRKDKVTATAVYNTTLLIQITIKNNQVLYF